MRYAVAIVLIVVLSPFSGIVSANTSKIGYKIRVSLDNGALLDSGPARI